MLDRRGRFITLEGGEGAGKSTQARRLAEWLRGKGLTVIETREPGGSDGAEAIRELLVHGEAGRWSPMAETLLLNAARADHVERVIEPALSRGEWVVCDRFADSTLAYQGAAGGLGPDIVTALHSLVFGASAPDLTLIFDLDPATGEQRVAERGEARTRFEKKGEAFHDALRQSFLDIAKDDPDRCIVIDAGAEIDPVASAVREAVSERLTPD